MKNKKYNKRLDALEEIYKSGDIMLLEGGETFLARPDAITYMRDHGRFTPNGEKIIGYKQPENKPKFENVLIVCCDIETDENGHERRLHCVIN